MSDESENQYSAIEKETKDINSEIKKCLEKINTKDDTKTLRCQLSFALFKRGVHRLEALNFVGSVYDLTLSLQYHVQAVTFFKRGILFAKLEFYEQALADFQSSFEYTTNPKHKEELEVRIAKLKEIVEKSQLNA